METNNSFSFYVESVYLILCVLSFLAYMFVKKLIHTWREGVFLLPPIFIWGLHFLLIVCVLWLSNYLELFGEFTNHFIVSFIIFNVFLHVIEFILTYLWFKWALLELNEATQQAHF